MSFCNPSCLIDKTTHFRSTTINTFTLKILFIYLFCTAPAYAYLDPGTGSMIIQMAIAGFLSALFTIKMYWYRIKAVVNRMLGRKVDESYKEFLLDDATNENHDKNQQP